MTPAKRLFRIKNITCIRGERTLFQNVSFDVESGAAVHLHGPNGAGKTSLLRILAGALPRAAGEILWDDEDFLKKGVATHGGRFSYLPSDDRYLKVLETARENLGFWCSLWNIEAAAIRPALEAVRLGALADRPVRVFSAGQKRRLSLARVLLRAPGDAPLWLLDEPLNGLDAAATALFTQALDRHLTAGGMAVIASHLPVDVAVVTRIDISRARGAA